MTKEIKFDREASYYGRNGAGKQTGIGIIPVGGQDPDHIILCPINSRGPSDAAALRIPIENVTAFANALLNISDPE